MDSRSLELPSARQNWFLAALVLVFIGLSIQYGLKANHDRSAILRWRPQIQQLEQIDIYQQYTYPNPPIMALLLTPIAYLPPLEGSLVWFYLKVGMTLLAMHWVFRMVEEPGQPFPLAGKVAVVLLSLRPIMGDLSHGNVNLFILFLIIGALNAYWHHQDLICGIILGLAIACKVTPLLFVPYFVWKRSWATIAGCAIGLILFLFVVPALFLGTGRNLQLLTSWYGCMIQPFVSSGEVTKEVVNQSLPGLIFRLFTANPESFANDNQIVYENVAALDPRMLGWFLKICNAGFAALIVWTCRTSTKSRYGWRLMAEFGLVLLGMLLFSERTWKHHCVTLILPFAVVVYYLAFCRPGIRLRYYLVGTLVVVMLLMVLTSTTGFITSWDLIGKISQAEGAYVWAFLLLTAALVVMLRQKTNLIPELNSSDLAITDRPQKLSGPHDSSTLKAFKPTSAS